MSDLRDKHRSTRIGLKSAVKGREHYFFQDVDLRLEHVKSFLLLGGYIGADTAVCSSRDTPFGIFYVVESNRIVFHAVSDLRQDPEKIRERFSE